MKLRLWKRGQQSSLESPRHFGEFVYIVVKNSVAYDCASVVLLFWMMLTLLPLVQAVVMCHQHPIEKMNVRKSSLSLRRIPLHALRLSDFPSKEEATRLASLGIGITHTGKEAASCSVTSSCMPCSCSKLNYFCLFRFVVFSGCFDVSPNHLDCSVRCQ